MMRFLLIILIAVLLNMPAFGQQTAFEWIARGDELFQNGKYNESLRAFDNAIEKDPNSIQAWNNKAKVLDAMGKYDQATKSFDNARQIQNDFRRPFRYPIPNWIIIPIVTVFIAIMGYFATYLNNIRISKRNAKIERVNRQLNELYGPLYALSHISKKLFEDFTTRNNMTGPDNIWVFANDEQREEWILWMKTVFMPNNLSIYRLIRTKADLLIENDLDPSLLDACAHTGDWEIMLKKWKDWKEGGMSSERPDVTPKVAFPDNLGNYAHESFKKLKREQEELMGKHG